MCGGQTDASPLDSRSAPLRQGTASVLSCTRHAGPREAVQRTPPPRSPHILSRRVKARTHVPTHDAARVEEWCEGGGWETSAPFETSTRHRVSSAFDFSLVRRGRMEREEGEGGGVRGRQGGGRASEQPFEEPLTTHTHVQGLLRRNTPQPLSSPPPFFTKYFGTPVRGHAHPRSHVRPYWMQHRLIDLPLPTHIHTQTASGTRTRRLLFSATQHRSRTQPHTHTHAHTCRGTLVYVR